MRMHKDGWRKVDLRTKGSHIQLKHPTKQGKVTIPNHKGDLAPAQLTANKQG